MLAVFDAFLFAGPFLSAARFLPETLICSRQTESIYTLRVTGVQVEEIMKHTYSVLPIYEQIIDVVLKFGICKLSEVCSFKLGVPVGPMLAKPTTGGSEVLNKFQDMDFTCEYKYDGERAQVLLIFPPLMFLL